MRAPGLSREANLDRGSIRGGQSENGRSPSREQQEDLRNLGRSARTGGLMVEVVGRGDEVSNGEVVDGGRGGTVVVAGCISGPVVEAGMEPGGSRGFFRRRRGVCGCGPPLRVIESVEGDAEEEVGVNQVDLGGEDSGVVGEPGGFLGFGAEGPMFGGRDEHVLCWSREQDDAKVYMGEFGQCGEIGEVRVVEDFIDPGIIWIGYLASAETLAHRVEH
mmetsp:Transcript_13521/g.42686  ORF Transcript_13521/g.42686 Transcript_13521/m.42686 type:complete len:218 (-) Transcript_13521:637-1290(-)